MKINYIQPNGVRRTGTFSSLLTLVEKDFGALPIDAGSFDITGQSGLVTNAPVFIQQANGPYTAKGTLDDDSQFDVIAITAYALNATTIRAHWCAVTGPVSGNFKFIYAA